MKDGSGYRMKEDLTARIMLNGSGHGSDYRMKEDHLQIPPHLWYSDEVWSYLEVVFQSLANFLYNYQLEVRNQDGITRFKKMVETFPRVKPTRRTMSKDGLQSDSKSLKNKQ